MEFFSHVLGKCGLNPADFVVAHNTVGGRVSVRAQSPHLRTPNPGFNPGFTPLLYNKCGGEPRVKPGVWRSEMWAQDENYNWCSTQAVLAVQCKLEKNYKW
jgi:hypothetical protein